MPIAAWKNQSIVESDRPTVCSWKVRANYHDIVVAGERNPDAAWTSPEPSQAVKKVEGYLAWKGLKIRDGPSRTTMMAAHTHSRPWSMFTLEHFQWGLIGALASLLITGCSPSSGFEPGSAEAPSPGAADADVTYVRAVQAEEGSWTFHVTVVHPDTGWEDYADGWNVIAPEDKILKRNPDDAFTRTLLHPHVDEQPFTRSQAGIMIPEGVLTLTVQAHDILHGFGGKEVVLNLSSEKGEGYEIVRLGD